jgi:hypothetical protein
MLSACANVEPRQAENCRDGAAAAEIEALREKLRAEEARAAGLQQKLDALKAIEQQIQQRQTPSAEATK